MNRLFDRQMHPPMSRQDRTRAGPRQAVDTGKPCPEPAVRVAPLTRHDRPENPPEDAAAGPAVALLAQGSGWLDGGATPVLLAAPSLLLLPPAARGKVRFEPGAAGVLVTLERSFAHWLSAREPAFVALFGQPRALALRRCGAELRRLESTLAALSRELELAAAARVTATEAHLQLLLTEALRLLEHAPSPATAAGAGSLLERSAQLVGEFMRLTLEHARERWRLPEYARALNVSTGYLRASCVRVTGSPPVQLIHECLIREAKRRLLATAAPVGAIALELGFEDAAYFSRLFHAKSGFSPTQYRLSFR